jgi:ubiquinone/menaquinone biosynthesis C-methylase UbiE
MTKNVNFVKKFTFFGRLVREPTGFLNKSIGSAENTSLQSNSIDFVVVGQAFHWFDAPQALNEFKRILKKDGVFVLIWYNRKTDTPFLKEYENVLQNNPAYKGEYA